MLLQQIFMVILSVFIFNDTYPQKYNLSYTIVFLLMCLLMDALVLFHCIVKKQKSNQIKTV